MTYDKLLAAVNGRHEELSDMPEHQRLELLKREFQLSTSEILDLLGTKDALDFGQSDDS